MKKKVVSLIVVGTGFIGLNGLIPAQAQAVYLPSVGPGLAKQETLRTMPKFSFWRYRSTGWVDCGQGKINRTTWVCRVTIIKRRTCQLGRSRVYSRWDWYAESVVISTRIRLGNRYPCEGVNY
jgi:hypothetical protein